MQQLRLGILGCGQVGTGLISILQKKRKEYRDKTGIDFVIHKVAVKNKRKKRGVKIASRLLTEKPEEVVMDPSVDIVIELLGGTTLARKLVVKALSQGKNVVTANKALLAEHGDEIFDLAVKKKAWIAFEASVGGGIPVIKGLREGLVANRIQSIHSIINGTSNYILSQMTELGADFGETLKEAQAKGYAEADPTFDIEGVDAAHKLAILIRFAFGGKVSFKDVHCEGISRIRKEDIAFAQEFGYRIKLLAIAKMTKEGVEARVEPALLPESHILANVRGAFNAVLMEGDEVGPSLMYGLGAGPHPTASAVISDLMDIAKRGSKRFFDPTFFMRGLKRKCKIRRLSSVLSRYYVRFSIIDQPGVLASIAKVLGKYHVSISDCVQKEQSAGNVVPLIILTHGTTDKNMQSAIKQIDKLKTIRGKSQVIRIEGSK